MIRRKTYAAAFLALLLATAAGAQTLVGTITGRIADEQGGVLPGVTVTLTGRTGSSTTVTDGEGVYRFPALTPGVYEVKAELSGFVPLLERAIDVSIGKEVTVNFTLKVGGLTESVEVTANASAVDASSSSTDNSLSQDLLFNMPLNRSNAAVNILNNTPGINSGSAYGGNSDSANALMLDGVDTRDPEAGTAWTFFNYNIIDEVQVSGIGANAEYGGFTGAVVNTVTKSGGNRPSGLFEIRYTNDSLSSDNVSADVAAENAALGDPIIVTKLVDYTVQLGGPIKRDKAFFFASVQRYSVRDNPTGPRTLHTEVSPRYNGKLTFQPTPSDTIIGSLQYDNYNQTGRRSYFCGDDCADQQTVKQDSPEAIWNGQYRKVIGSNTFFEAKFTGYWGYYDLDPSDPAHEMRIDGETGGYSGGGGYIAKYDRTRNQLNASLSHYAEALGRHNFKFGVEIERSKIRNRQEFVGQGVYFYDLGGLPYLAYGYAYDLEGKNSRESFYAQDSWKIGRLTANVGVRIDRIGGKDSNTGESLYSSTSVGPRAGVAYDLTGAGNSVLRAFWGRYYDGAMFSVYSRATVGNTPFVTYEVLPGDVLVETDSTPPVIYGMADNIDHPRVDEFNASFEHQLRKDMRIAVTGIWRENGNFINSAIRGSTWTPVTLTNGLTGQPFTGYRWANSADTEENFFISNIDGFAYVQPDGTVIGTAAPSRKYKALMLVFSKAFTNRWSAQASYVYSKTTGTISNSSTSTLNSRQFETANTALINVDGEAFYSRPHEFKLYGTYQIPKIEVGLNAYYRAVSGTAWTPYQRYTNSQVNFSFSGTAREIWLEPRGSRRNDMLHVVDTRFEKLFEFQGNRFGIYADVENLFNVGTITDRQARYPSIAIAGAGDVAFDAPRAVTPGRQITFGGRWSF